MGNYVNPHAGARRIEQKKKKYINPHSGAERNRGGVVEGTAYLAGNLGLGLAGVAEGIADIAVAGSHLSRGDLYMAKQPFLDNQTAQAQQDLTEWYNPGKGMRFAGDVASGIGNSLTFMIPYVGPYLAAAGYLGMGISGAAEKTGDVGIKEIGYGAANAGMEFVTDKFVGGAGQAGKSIMSSLTRKGAATAGKATAKMAGKSATAYMLREIGKGALGEFAEEASTEAVDPLLQRLFGIDKNASTTLRDVAYAGLVGALSGGLMTAGPAAINFESARNTGQAIREGGEVEQVLHTAEMLIKGSERAQAAAKGTKTAEKADKTDKTDKATSVVDKIKDTAAGAVGGIKRGRAASAAGEMADKLRRNVAAYRQIMADPTRATSSAADALLGELRGNMYLAQVAYQMETYEAVLMDAEPEQKQQIVDVINAEAAKRGAKRSDYTVADLEANVDDILTSTAGRAVLESMMREMAGEAAEAPQSPVEAQEDVWAGMPADADMAALGVAGEAENALIKAAVNQGVPRGSVPAMLKQFRKGTKLTPAEFAEGWADGAHKYGRYGFDASKDGDTAFNRMEPEAREAAVKFGRETEEAERKAAEEKAKAKKKPAEMAGKKGTVVRGKGLEIKTLSDEQYAAYKAAEVLAEVLGTEIVIETAITDKKGRTVNGYYDTKTNRLHVNINALRDGKNISLYTIGHEVAHYIKEWSPTKFEALADFVLDQMGVDAETAVAEKLASLKRLGIVTDTMTVAEANALAREELVAEGMELVLTDGKVLEELSKTDKSLWEKIRDWFADVIDKIRKHYGELNQASKTAQVLKETVESLEEIERLFTEGVREAGERTRTAGVDVTISGDGDIIYAIGDETTKKASELSEADLLIMLENAQYGEFDDGTYIPLRRNTPEFYIEVVRDHSKGKVMVQNYPMAATVEHLRQNMEEVDGRSYGDKRPHELSPDEIVTISRKMGDPAYIVLQKNGRYAEVVSYYDSKKKKEIVVSIDIADSNSTPPKNFKYSSYMNGYDGGYYNIIVTQYELDDLQSYLDGTTVVYDKKKTNGTYQVGSGRVVTVTHDTPFVEDIVAQSDDSVNRKFSISENIPSTLSAEDQSILFDADFYERYENESRGPITETVEELEAAKASEAFATMSDDEVFDLNAKLKAKRAGYNTVYDYYVETEKERMAEEYRRYVQTGRSNRTSRTLEEKRKKVQKERALRSDADSATPLQNAQYQIIQETNPMWDEYHTGIRSPKEIKTFAETVEDPDSFNWGDFTHEDAEKALRDGTVRVYSSYTIKNGVFVSTSYKQALQYAGNNPDGVHTRVVALDSVAWINGDEGQYAKVYRDDRIRYSIDETPETQDVSAFDAAVRRSGISPRATDKETQRMIKEAEKRARAAERSAERSAKSEQATKEWARETVRKTRDQRDEAVYRARRDAVEYKNAVYRVAYAKADEKNRAYRETMNRKAEEARARKEMTARKRTIMRVLGGLQTKLYNPTKTNHVPKELHDLVTKIMQTADPKAWDENRKNIREMGDLAADIEKLERKADRTEREQERLDAMKSKYEILESKTMPLKKQAEALYTAYKLYNETLPKDMQIPEGPIAELSKLVDTIEDAPLKEMGLESLRAVETFVKALSHQINSANDLFLQKRGEQVSDWGNAASREAAESKPLKWLSPKSMEIKNARDVRDFLWKNMKPLTVFEAVGSPKLMELFHSVLDGEEVWITDILEAREVILKAKERYKYDTWDLKTRREFTNAEGKVVRLTVGEMMSLYAYAKREQAMGHLRGGGFVLDTGATEITEKRKVRTERRMNLTERYTMTEEDMGKLAGMLTEEQKKYADEMQDYLTSLGAKGNEISQKLYGLDLFNEKHYFPIKVKSEYLESQTGKTGDPKIKNRGMAKETVPDAENPLVLQDFMDIFNGHVNDMATYHAFVLPVEDLTRVLNYQPSNAVIDEDGNWTEDKERKEYSTLKAVIESKYGAQANAYIEQLIRDLNGGARREAAVNLIDKGITAFKRASTMASLSVLVQQPTSLFRAMAYVDPKYFRSLAALDIKGHKEAWEQVKKYAKVAAIKEMGGYDTGVGTRTADYLNSKEYKTWGERAKAFFLPDVYGGDSNYRAEIFGKGAAYADELAWIQMFDACKREQAEKLGKPMDSEEVLEAAGKRFTEVVRRTQVYDATLARSEYMRSKDTGMKMATAFMAEPTTVVSMMLDGLIRSNRGDKAFFKRTAGAIAASVIFNALAVSLVYAARDDDEEKTFAEKYLATLATETAEGFNPLEYLPYTRDIMSLMKGYDIERTDMALFADLFKSFERITSSTRTPAEKTAEVAGAVGAFFGVPIRNLVRDAMMPVNLVQGAMSGERTTGKGISAAMADEFSTITKLFGADTTNAHQLYKAAKSGDEAHYNRVASRYKSEQAAEMALRTALRENDKRIAEAAEAKISGELEAYESIIDQIESEGRFDRNLIIRAINNEVLDIKDSAEQVTAPVEDATDEDEDTPESLYNASDLNDALTRGDREDFEDIYYYLLATKQEQGKTEAQAKAAVKSGITSYWKKRYLAAWDENNTAEMKRILELLEGTELYGEYNDVATMASKWIKES